MKYTKNILTIAFAAILLIGSAAVSTQAQRRGGHFIYRSPVIVRPYFYGFHRHWNPFYDSYFGDPFYYDPYLSERRERSYLQNELNGDEKELRKHLEKYNADGVITEKERRELQDDYSDIARAKRKLQEFNRNR